MLAHLAKEEKVVAESVDARYIETRRQMDAKKALKLE